MYVTTQEASKYFNLSSYYELRIMKIQRYWRLSICTMMKPRLFYINYIKL